MIQLLLPLIYIAFISLGLPDSLLGAGSVDAALNNYVALHYESRHMSWLHCMWGVGTVIGPYNSGYVTLWYPDGVSGIFDNRTGMCPYLPLYYSFHTGLFRSGQIPGYHRSTDGQCLYRNLCNAAALRPDCKSYQCGTFAGLSSCYFGGNGGYA